MEGVREHVLRRVVACAGIETAALEIVAAHRTTSAMLAVSIAALAKLVILLPVLILSFTIHWSARIAVRGMDVG
jgi:hypothetical protein